jgi:photosystem II stability/assembly factor-like uncharacterized protein
MRTILLLLLCLLAVRDADAQWRIVADSLVRPGSGTGCMARIDTTIWLGCDSLYRSTDKGLTWQTDPAWPINIVAMHWYDKDNGVLTAVMAVYRTTDGGATWEEILDAFAARGVGFFGSPELIVVAGANTLGFISITTDGGKNWRNVRTDDWNHGIGYVMASDFSDPPSRVWRTRDFGASWVRLNPMLPYDIYSIAIDSCDPNIVYAMNEDFAGTDDGFSQVYQSTDAGESWQPVLEEQRYYFNGAIYVSGQAVYAPSLDSGRSMHRSIDAGKTWVEIGGPKLRDDTRLFCSYNDSILVGVDREGNVWRTENAGGHLFAPTARNITAALFPNSVFGGDTIRACGDSTFAMAYLRGGACGPLTVVSQEIIGPDAISFMLEKQISNNFAGDDSARFTFSPSRLGEHHAIFRVTLSDGTTREVVLNAIAAGAKTVALTSIDLQNDTIGGEVRIPISLLGGNGMSAIELSLHFDSTFLSYEGTLTPEGIAIDLDRSGTSARVRLPASEHDTKTDVAYAVFKVYPKSNPCTTITIDSIVAVGEKAECLEVLTDRITVNVCSIAGCGVDLISNLVRYGRLPSTLRIYPNPATTSTVVETDRPASNAIYQLIDANGKLVNEGTFVGNRFEIDLTSVASGSYVIHVRSELGSRFGMLQKR